MNPDKLTQKTNEAIANAHELGISSGHAQFTPLHLAQALVNDPGGILRQAIANASGGAGEVTVASFERVVNKALKKIPSQHPPPDEIPASTSLIKALRRAQSSQKQHGDTHLAVNQLILGLLEDSQIGDCIKEAGIAASRVRSEVEKLRGKEGRKVECRGGCLRRRWLTAKGND